MPDLDPERRPRVLIVDDQPANIHVLKAALGDDYEIQFATSGTRALELAESGQIDLVLLDVRMPDLDGFEVCWRLKANERTRHTLVMFVTALDEVQDEARGFEMGGVDYITKPISPPLVRARVRTQLELKRSRDLLADLAAVDALTGLATRRRFDERLELEFRRAGREGTCLAVGMAALDHLEALNDRCGRARGDEAVKAVSLALSTVTRRPADLLARYGGGEFALLFPGIRAEGAGERMRALIEEVAVLGVEHPASPVAGRVTVTAGATVFKAPMLASPAAALERARECLDQAKQAGRNRALLEDLESGEKRVILPGS